jgi:hypothetical protein
MERKDQQQEEPGKEQQPMAQPKDQGKRKPESEDEEMDKSVGKVPDPQGENPEQKRDQV